MKTLFLISLLNLLVIFPSISQVEEKVGEEVPLKEIIVPIDKIPATVVKAAKHDFIDGDVLQWSKISQLFNEYEWNVKPNKSGAEIPDEYMVYMKTKDGSNMVAVYTKDGKLVRSKEKIKNAIVPQVIEKSIQEGAYKGWKTVGDKELVKDYQNKLAKHYIVRVQKGNQKRTLYFDDNEYKNSENH